MLILPLNVWFVKIPDSGHQKLETTDFFVCVRTCHFHGCPNIITHQTIETPPDPGTERRMKHLPSVKYPTPGAKTSDKSTSESHQWIEETQLESVSFGLLGVNVKLCLFFFRSLKTQASLISCNFHFRRKLAFNMPNLWCRSPLSFFCQAQQVQHTYHSDLSESRVFDSPVLCIQSSAEKQHQNVANDPPFVGYSVDT